MAAMWCGPAACPKEKNKTLRNIMTKILVFKETESGCIIVVFLTDLQGQNKADVFLSNSVNYQAFIWFSLSFFGTQTETDHQVFFFYYLHESIVICFSKILPMS